MDSNLFVPAKLTFSVYLRCLNFPLWILWTAKAKKAQESNLFCDTIPIKSSKIKHLKFSENVNFVETNSVDSILDTIGLYRQTIKEEISLTLKFARKGVGGRPKVDLVVTKECSSFLGAAVYVWQQYSLRLKLSTKSCFMKQKYHLQIGLTNTEMIPRH